jgi:arylsulfatase A-like enzyme
MTIPWVIAGPGVVHRGLLTRPVQTLDTALTILQVLGLPPAAKMAGKVVSEAFEPQ